MNNLSAKFSNLTRLQLIQAAEQHYCVRLRKVGRHDRWLRDELGRNWWILGGKLLFHGISMEMMDDELQAEKEGRMIVGIWGKTKIRIFGGTTGPLIRKRNLFRDSKGGYKLNFRESGGRLILPKCPNFSLVHFSSHSYTDEDLDNDKRTKQIEKIFNKLSPLERKRLLDRLEKFERS